MLAKTAPLNILALQAFADKSVNAVDNPTYG